MLSRKKTWLHTITPQGFTEPMHIVVSSRILFSCLIIIFSEKLPSSIPTHFSKPHTPLPTNIPSRLPRQEAPHQGWPPPPPVKGGGTMLNLERHAEWMRMKNKLQWRRFHGDIREPETQQETAGAGKGGKREDRQGWASTETHSSEIKKAKSLELHPTPWSYSKHDGGGWKLSPKSCSPST